MTKEELLEIKRKAELWNPFTEDVNILEMGLAEYNKRHAGNNVALEVLPLVPQLIDELLKPTELGSINLHLGMPFLIALAISYDIVFFGSFCPKGEYQNQISGHFWAETDPSNFS